MNVLIHEKYANWTEKNWTEHDLIEFLKTHHVNDNGNALEPRKILSPCEVCDAESEGHEAYSRSHMCKKHTIFVCGSCYNEIPVTYEISNGTRSEEVYDDGRIFKIQMGEMKKISYHKTCNCPEFSIINIFPEYYLN